MGPVQVQHPIPTVSFSFNRAPKLVDPYTYENEMPTAWPRQPERPVNPQKPVHPEKPVYPSNPFYPYERVKAQKSPISTDSEVKQSEPVSLISVGLPVNPSSPSALPVYPYNDPFLSSTTNVLAPVNPDLVVPAEVHPPPRFDSQNLL
jgi:hypothetical protein